MAMLAAGLLCVTSFSACDDDEDDSKQYFYELAADLTDPGSMTPAEIKANQDDLDYLENYYNTNILTSTLSSGNAKKALQKVVKKFKEGIAGEANTLTKPVTITFSMKNKSTGNVEFSETVTIQPSK